MDLSLNRLASVALNALNKEASALQTLNEEVKATVKRMVAEDPGLEELLNKSHGYAVFPSVGKAGAVVGGAFGKGEVFEQGKLVGYAGLMQLTIGVQLGGDTYSQIIAFENKESLDRFKGGRTAFAANASAVLVKAGAAKSARFEAGAAVFISTEGGMMLEAAIGAQKFVFKPAALGRTQSAPDTEPETEHEDAPERKEKPASRPKPGKASKARKTNPKKRQRRAPAARTRTKSKSARAKRSGSASNNGQRRGTTASRTPKRAKPRRLQRASR